LIHLFGDQIEEKIKKDGVDDQNLKKAGRHRTAAAIDQQRHPN
jgi:sugar/nucleoside kinase (ribokinase family)